MENAKMVCELPDEMSDNLRSAKEWSDIERKKFTDYVDAAKTPKDFVYGLMAPGLGLDILEYGDTPFDELPQDVAEKFFKKWDALGSEMRIDGMDGEEWFES